MEALGKFAYPAYRAPVRSARGLPTVPPVAKLVGTFEVAEVDLAEFVVLLLVVVVVLLVSGVVKEAPEVVLAEAPEEAGCDFGAAPRIKWTVWPVLIL